MQALKAFGIAVYFLLVLLVSTILSLWIMPGGEW